MANLKPGDTVVCRVKHRKIVAASSIRYDEERTFEIISTDSNGCFLYIPDYYPLHDTIEITQSTILSLNILPRFIGSRLIYVLSSYIVRLGARLDGCLCVQCGEFYAFAQPNRGDGKLVCWSCRNDRYR